MKMTVKKAVALFCATIILAFTMAACKPPKDNDTQRPPNVPTIDPRTGVREYGEVG